MFNENIVQDILIRSGEISYGVIENLEKVLELDLDGNRVMDLFSPIDLLIGLSKQFTNIKVNNDPEFLDFSCDVDYVLSNNEELSKLISNAGLSDGGLALVNYGLNLIALDEYADEVIKKRIKSGLFTDKNKKELLDANISLNIATINMIEEALKKREFKTKESILEAFKKCEITDTDFFNALNNGNISVPYLMENLSQEDFQRAMDIAAKHVKSKREAEAKKEEEKIAEAKEAKKEEENKCDCLACQLEKKIYTEEDMARKEEEIFKRIKNGGITDEEIAESLLALDIDPVRLEEVLPVERVCKIAKISIGKLIAKSMFASMPSPDEILNNIFAKDKGIEFDKDEVIKIKDDMFAIRVDKDKADALKKALCK